MRWLPKSLLSRSALLIGGLMLVSQLTTAVFFLYWVQLPRLVVLVDLAENHLHTVRVTLSLLPEAQRSVYLQEMAHNKGLHLQIEEPRLIADDAMASRVILKFLQLFETRLKPGEKAYYQTTPEQAVWVRLNVDGTPYWVKFSAQPFSADLTEHWLGLSVLVALLAFVGGFIIYRTLNKPLQNLVVLVSKIGKGERVEPFEEKGPKEIVAFIRAINVMDADLRQMEADRTLMLAGISHDLRTPITRIQLALEMIGGDFDPELKARIIANLAEIEGGLKQCLDYARDSAEEPLQLADLNDLARLCAASYKINGFMIGLDLCEEAETMIRPFAVERLLRNLLDNALKYAGKDVVIFTRVCDGSVILSVLDRGKGISEADIDNLRRPFARAEKSRGGSVGYGLGLAIVDKIIEAHHASIEFLPRLGGGLEVRVVFCAVS